MSLLGSACRPDACETLCDQTGSEIETCIDGGEWPLSFKDFDATDQADFVLRCRNGWSQTRARLESRELDDALSQCEEAADALVAASEASAGGAAGEAGACDELRALYLY